MRLFFLLICLPLYPFSTAGQNIKFEYDNGGNRILRKATEALPVTLVSFNLNKFNPVGNDAAQHDIALLTWQTSTEINADRFNIQRSADGKSWRDIGSVLAKGAFTQANEVSNTDYSFIDEKPLNGDNLYRLKMIDKDDSFAYSQLRSLYFEFEILAYPNPVKTFLTLKSSDFQTVQLFNAQGQLVYSALNNVSSIDVSSLPAGIYILKAAGNDGSIFTRKIVKQ